MYFQNYGLPKTCSHKCVKNPGSEDDSTGNTVTGPKHSCNFNDNTFTIFIDHCEGNWLEKGYFSDMKNVKTVCQHIDCE